MACTAISLAPSGEFIGYVQLRNLADTTEGLKAGYKRWFPWQEGVEMLAEGLGGVCTRRGARGVGGGERQGGAG